MGENSKAPNSTLGSTSKVEPPLDFTFMSLASVTDCLDEEPRSPGGKKKASALLANGERHLFNSNAIRLSNNVISDWEQFSETMAKLVREPTAIEWIDLSFNDITHIDKCLLDFPNLKVLYLHGNGLESMLEVDKLAGLHHLKTLTLHGNPIEEASPGYRHYVLSRLPRLKKFDFSAVTKQDKECAVTWNEKYGRSRRKRDS